MYPACGRREGVGATSPRSGFCVPSCAGSLVRLKANIVRAGTFIILSSQDRREDHERAHTSNVGSELKAISNSIFRRPPPVDDAKALADFIDQQSAFVVREGIMNTRVPAPDTTQRCCSRSSRSRTPSTDRAGLPTHRARRWWQSSPRACCAHCRRASRSQPATADALRGVRPLRLRSLSRTRGSRRAAVERGSTRIGTPLQLIGLHIRPSALSKSRSVREGLLRPMPINERLGRSEFLTIHGYLKVTLCNVDTRS